MPIMLKKDKQALLHNPKAVLLHVQLDNTLSTLADCACIKEKQTRIFF